MACSYRRKITRYIEALVPDSFDLYSLEFPFELLNFEYMWSTDADNPEGQLLADLFHAYLPMYPSCNNSSQGAIQVNVKPIIFQVIDIVWK